MNTKNDRTVVVAGLDKDGKPRGGSYPSNMLKMAQDDAAIWKLQVGKAESEAALTYAKDLPSGEMFPSTKIELPVIKPETYELLQKTIKWQPGAKSKQSTKSEGSPANPWDSIVVGSKVLAKDPDEDGFYTAVVQEVSDDKKTLTLKWANYPKLPAFKVRRMSVGLVVGK